MVELRIERPDQLLRDRVTDTLRAAVLQGVFSPGDRLTERELGELTGVSRTSLREGLRQLQGEGLVEAAPGRGLRVTVLSEQELGELYEVREYLESAAVELFVQRATEEQIDALDRSLHSSSLPESKDDVRSGYYDNLFAGAGNPLLRKLYDSIAARIVMMQNLSIRTPGRAEETRREGEELLGWIRKRDAPRAALAARHHVRMAKESALRALQARLADSD